MAKHGLVATLVVGFSLGLCAQGAASPQAQHHPPKQGFRGEPLEISVRVENLGAEADVTLFYKPQGARDFSSLKLERVSVARYFGEIPESGTGSLSVDYYVEINAPERNWSYGLGSRMSPMSVPLEASRLSKTRRWLGVESLVLAPLVMLAGVMWRRSRRERRRLKDRLFWIKTLGPVVRLRGDQYSRALDRLVKEPLAHPLYGRKRYPRTFLLQKAREVRSWDRANLLLEQSSPAASAPKKPSPQPSRRARQTARQRAGSPGRST